MDLYTTIYERRAVRQFAATPVNPMILHRLLAAAVQAPSACNAQPWAFGVFQGRTRLDDFSTRAKAYLLSTSDPAFALHSPDDLYADDAYDLFHGAPTLVVIFARHLGLHPAEDCCLAAENLMLAACADGLATCPIGCIRPWLNSTEVKRELALPDDLTAVFPLALGYPAGEAAGVPRTEPEIVCWAETDR